MVWRHKKTRFGGFFYYLYKQNELSGVPESDRYPLTRACIVASEPSASASL